LFDYHSTLLCENFLYPGRTLKNARHEHG
jgi:hypothetical protein